MYHSFWLVLGYQTSEQGETVQGQPSELAKQKNLRNTTGRTCPGSVHSSKLTGEMLLSSLKTLHHCAMSYFQEGEHSIQDSVITSSQHEIREMGHLIKHILSRTGPVTVHGVLDGPGGCHDNDLADFRDITILLTADEILAESLPSFAHLLTTFLAHQRR